VIITAKVIKPNGYYYIEKPDYNSGFLPVTCAYNRDIEVLYTKLEPVMARNYVNLKYILTPCTGTQHIDLTDSNAKLIYLDDKDWLHQNIHATAEFTFALILALTRQMGSATGASDRYKFTGNDLYGKTLGIIGYGRVGKQVEKIALGFGMQVVVADVDTPKNVFDKRVLSEADIVTLHVPGTPENEGLIDNKEFSIMKQSAYLINTSRSNVVDPYALLCAIHTDQIKGAALDVTETYCDWITKHLIDTDRVLVTPHLAGNTVESRRKTDEYVFNKLAKILGEER